MLKDMCDIIALSTIPAFSKACKERKDSLEYIETALVHIKENGLLKQVSINLFNEEATEYITRFIDTRIKIIRDSKSG